MSKPRRFAICCNDYRNGMFAGTFDAMQLTIGGELAEFDGPPTVIRHLSPGVLRIGRRKFAHHGCAEWVGNWCWNEYAIANPTDLLAYLKSKGWVCGCAPTRFFEAFNAPAKPAERDTEADA